MKTVRVDLGERSYDIRIGAGLDPADDPVCRGTRRALIISDSNVDPLYGKKCETRLREKGVETARTVVAAGESSKNLDSAKELYSEVFVHGLDRSSLIIALGGGMAGDLAGFVAATVYRGIKLVQMPTTLLAMVDSSVGGKTGVNVPEGKNLVGSFYQPCGVTADISTLETLPEREYVSGLAEVVKYGVIWDSDLFARLEKDSRSLLDRDRSVLEDVIARCCEIKAEIVAGDEKEAGVRAVLNFGHTLGHALEQNLGYGTCLHGETVSAGMVYAAGLSKAFKGLPESDFERIVSLLFAFGLPTDPAGPDGSCEWNDLREAIVMDKKTVDGTPKFILVKRVGEVEFGCAVEESVLREVFDGFKGA